MKPIARSDGRWTVFVPRKVSESGKREAKYFPSKNQATKFCAEFRTDHREHGRQAISSEERHWINVARNELGDLSKLRAVLDHWTRTGRNVQPISASNAAEQFIAYRTSEKLNPGTVHDITWRLHAFGKAFGATNLHEITPGQIDNFLRTRSEGWDRRSFWKRIRPLFSHAHRQRWLIENPFDELEPPRTPGGRRDVYTPEQYGELLLSACYDDEAVTLFLALSGLAFMRSQELVRRFENEPVLEWGDVWFDRKEIHVREEVGKSTRRKSSDERFPPIHPALESWLLLYRKPAGRVVDCSVRSFRERLKVVFDRAKVPFIPNGLRHSAISYWLARFPELGVAQVAQYAGNSEPSCRLHYLKILTKEQGEAWFNSAKP